MSLSLRLGAFLVGLAVLGTVGAVLRNRVLSALVVSGPAYQEIVAAQRLEGDYDASTLFIHEPFEVMNELVDLKAEGDSAGAARRLSSFRDLRDAYLARRQFWADHHIGDPGLSDLTARASQPALAFFRMFDEALVPALERKDYALARRIRNGPMDSLFLVHRERVRDVQERARHLVRVREVNAARSASKWTIGLWAGSIAVTTLMFSLAWVMLRRTVLQPIQDAIGHMTAIEKGQYDLSIDASRNDEIGDMLGALDSMRESLQTTTRALDEAQRMYSDIVRHSPAGIYRTTVDGEPIMVNDACARLLGYDTPQGFMDSTHSTGGVYVDEGTRTQLLERLESEGSVAGFHARMRRRDGSIIWTSNTARLVRDGDGSVTYIEGFMEDITARRLQEETIVHLATHDPLTDLPNRRAMDEGLTRAIARAKRGERSAFILIDFDNFKAINDSVGHQAGDRFLQSIGKLFRTALRPADTLARFGGDEFAVLLEGITANRARGVAERIREGLAAFRFQEGTYTFVPTASFGVALIEDGEQEPSHVVSVADGALHVAKEQGKNRCVVYQALTERETQFTEASQWAARIQDALAEDRFVLHFQPIVRLGDRSIAFYEALIRMEERDGTLTGPGAFIPAAERFGLSSAIDEWVINAVLEILAGSDHVPICVNLSGTSLGDEMLLARIERSIDAADIAPGQLILEITETSVIQDLMHARHWMDRLARLGCRFALDDFGTGFSSFSYLRSLPVHEVKIDGSFVQAIVTDPASRAMVEAMTHIAHALGMQVIGEWVEDEATATRLAAMGVDFGQGFLWPAPASLPAVEERQAMKRIS